MEISVYTYNNVKVMAPATNLGRKIFHIIQGIVGARIYEMNQKYPRNM